MKQVPAPLFGQLALFAWLAGLCAQAWTLPAFTACALLFVCAWERLKTLPRMLAILLCFALGTAWAWYNAPVIASYDATWDREERPVQGIVEQVDALTDRRLRIVMRLATDPASKIRASKIGASKAGASKVGAPSTEALKVSEPARLVFTWEEPLLRPLVGQELSARLRVLPITGFRNAGSSDFRAYWARRGVHYRAWGKGEKAQITVTGTPSRAAAYREDLRQRFLQALHAPVIKGTETETTNPVHLSQGYAILPALIFGDKFLLDSHCVDLFTRTDLVHSLALSGQHLALAVLAGTGLVFLLCLFFPQLLLRLPLPKMLALSSIPFVLIYLWIGNAPPSLLRAGVMMCIGALVMFAQKPRTLFDILCLAVLCLSIAMPSGIHDLGLQLSVLSVAAIALCAPFLDSLPFRPHTIEYEHKKLHDYARLLLFYFAGLLGLTLAIQWILLPVELLSFSALSSWGLLNLVWLPVLGIFILPLSGIAFVALACGLSPDTVHPLLALAAWPADQFISLLEYLDSQHWLIMYPGLRPHWSVVLGFWTSMIALLAGRRPQAKRIAYAAALLLFCGTGLRYAETLSPNITLRVLDVGQAQAIELVWPQGRALIDGGGFSSPRMDAGRDIVAPALLYMRPPRLDWVLNTHPDTDHLRGLLSILESFSVAQLGLHREPESGRNQIRYQRIKDRQLIAIRNLYAGQEIRLDADLILQVLHPPRENRLSTNDASLVLRLVRKGKGLALLTGDLEQQGIDILLASGQPLDADILVLPHHGSANGFSPALLQAVRPQRVLVSCGAYNRYGFPAPIIRNTLKASHIPLHTTAEEGELSIIWKPD